MNINKIKMYLVNALDVALILVILSVVVSAFFKIYNKHIFMLFDKTQKAIVTLSIYNEDIDTSDIKRGDKLYLSDDGEMIGKVVSVKKIKEKKYTAINNTIMVDYSDNNVGVLIEIETKIKENSSKKYINSSLFVAPGAVISVFGGTFEPSEAIIEDIVVE